MKTIEWSAGNVLTIPWGWRLWATNGIGTTRELFEGSPVRRTDKLSVQHFGGNFDVWPSLIFHQT